MTRSAGRAAGAVGAVAIALSAAATLLACASILDITELPLAAADAGAPSSDAGADATTDGCPPRGATYCTQQCPVPDFCDDFEGARLAENWDAPVGFPQPTVTGASAQPFLAHDDAGAQSQALFAEARSVTGESANCLLGESLARPIARRALRGARVRMDVRVVDLSFTVDSGSSNSVSFLAFGNVANLQGLGVQLYDEGTGKLRLGIEQRSLGGAGGGPRYDLLPDVLSGARENFASTSLPLDIVVGTPDVLRERKIPCSLEVDPDAGDVDAGDPNAVRVVIQFGPTVHKCAALRDELAAPDWLATAGFITGAAVSDFGHADLRIDNIAVYLYE